MKKPNCFFFLSIFQRVSRIILGPPKHVLHLVWSAYFISTALKTALKVAQIIGNGDQWKRKFLFGDGPNVKKKKKKRVKQIPLICGLISQGGNGEQFFSEKKLYLGGWGEGLA